jgi:hypothetical protein
MSSVLIAEAPRRMSLGRQWIGAHVLAQLICVAASAAAYGIGSVIGANDPAAGAALKSTAFWLAFGVELTFAISIAALRGLVLRQVLPNFSMLLWMAAVMAYVMSFYLLFGMSSAQNTAAGAASNMTASTWAVGISVAAVMALIMGLVIGSIEGLVLRRVADGAGRWALMVGLAWSAGIVLLVTFFAAADALLPGASAATLAVLGAVAKLALGALTGLITLPALRHLRPRQAS